MQLMAEIGQRLSGFLGGNKDAPAFKFNRKERRARKARAKMQKRSRVRNRHPSRRQKIGGSHQRFLRHRRRNRFG